MADAPPEGFRPLKTQELVGLVPGLADQEREDPLIQLFNRLERLKRLCPVLPFIGLSWTAMKHPLHLAQAEWLSRSSSEDRSSGAGWARFLGCGLYTALLTLRVAWLRVRWRRQVASLGKERFDIVVKCWRTDAVAKPEGSDFYFGDLQGRLRKRQVRTLFLFGDPSGRNWRFQPKDNSPAQQDHLPELAILPLWAPCALALEQWRASLRLSRLADRLEDPLETRIARRAGRDVLSPDAAWNALAYWIGKEVGRRWAPRALLTLYEGHGWERCLRRGVKEGFLPCRTIGYQHTVLLRHNLELLGSRQEGAADSRPEVVLCSGPRTQALLGPSHPRSVLISFGTFRGFPPSSISVEPSPARRTVLVLPEGYLSETQILFECALETARRLPEYRFILRYHPVAPIEQVRASLRQDPSRFHNVEISSGRSLEEEFARSSVTLYRGSSAALYAVQWGLKPIYWEGQGIDERDPLFELQDWRERIRTVELLEQSLRDYARQDPAASLPPWRRAREYVAQYSIPVGEASVDRLLWALEMPQGGCAQ